MAVRATALSFLSPVLSRRPAGAIPAGRSDTTGPRARTAALRALLVFGGLVACPPAGAVPGECIEDGGQAICSGKQAGPWEYRLCDDTAAYMSRMAAWCHVLHEGAQWNGPYATPMCAGTPIRLTETLLVAKAEEFTGRIDNCAAAGRFGGWLSPGERIDSSCWDGGPGYSDGLETSNLAEISVRCTDRDGGERIIAGRWRELSCPMGSAGPNCARFAEAACGVGNPIQPGQGNKQLTERDVGPTAAGALALVRHYNSHGYYRPRGSADVAAGGFGQHWRTAYDARLYPAEAFIVAQRPDGRIQYFDAAGNERLRYGGALERLEALGAAGEQGWRYITGEDTVEHYDPTGRLLSITHRGGHTQTLDYEVPLAEGGDGDPDTLDRVVGPFGRRLVFAYDERGRLVTVTAPGEAHYRYGYDEHGNLVSVTFPDDTPKDKSDNPTRRYHYEDARFANALTGITDENDKRFATYAYDAQGRAILSEHAGGAGRVAIAYHPDGTSTVTDALGNGSTYHFALVRGVLKATEASWPCPACSRTSQLSTYDSNGQLASKTDYNHHTTTYVHDDRGLELMRTEAAGTPEARTISTQWHPRFRLPVRLTEPGKETRFTYDAAGRLLTRTDNDMATGASRTWTHAYTARGLLASVDGPRLDLDDRTRYAYDERGNRIRIINALGHVTEIAAHDAHGRPLKVVDPNGLVTTLAYDARGRLVERDVGGAVTIFRYDAVGNLAYLGLPDGSDFEYTYDDAHRLVGLADNLGNRLEYTLDAAGNRVREEVLDPAGSLTRTRRRLYNQLSQLVEAIGGAEQRTVYRYDGEGNRLAMTDPNTHTTTYGYDGLNRLASLLDARGQRTDYGYDARDNLVAVTDPRGNLTRYAYDGLDNQTEETSPDRGRLVSGYDAAGNLVSRTDARGVTVTFTYDALNRQTAIQYPAPGENVTFTYDAGTHGIGRLTGMRDASGETEYVYDVRGNLLAETRTLDGVADTIAYRYDAAAKLTGITYPSGRTVTYRRDSAGRIVEITTTDDGQTRLLAESIRYLPFGPIQSLTFGNGITLTRTFDADYRLTAQSAGSVQHLTFGLDGRGNITGITDGLEPSRSQVFGYDALDRLVSASGPYGTREYLYDAAGNRTGLTRDLATDTYTIDPASNRLQALAGTRTQAWTYDAAGNTRTAGASRLVYNQANRLAEASGGDGRLTTYTYNARGERVKKSTATGTIRYHYDRRGHLLAESDAAGNPVREYVYVDGLRLAVITYGAADAEGRLQFTGTGPRNAQAALTVEPETHTVTVHEPPALAGTYAIAPENWQASDERISFQRALDPRTHLQGTVRLTEDPAVATLLVRTQPRRALYRLPAQPADGRYTGTGLVSGGSIALTLDESRRWIIIKEPGRPVRTLGPQPGWRRATAHGRFTILAFQAPDYRLRGWLSIEGGKARGYVYIEDGPRAATQYRLTQTRASSANSTAAIFYMHTDHLGTPQIITDADQSVVWRAHYTPFGKATVTKATIENPLRFPGQYFDAETGLHYNYFRDYDPSIGRYIESDPIGLTGGFNTYTYVANRPLVSVDASGLIGNFGKVGILDGGGSGFGAALPIVRGIGIGGAAGIDARRCCGADGYVYMEFVAVARGGASFGASSRVAPGSNITFVRIGELPPCVTQGGLAQGTWNVDIQMSGLVASTDLRDARMLAGLTWGRGWSATLNFFSAVQPIGKVRDSGSCNCQRED